MKTSYVVERLFDGQQMHHNVCVVVEDGMIAEISNSPVGESISLPGLLAPGLVDVQVNGGGGAFFNAEQNVAAIAQIAKAHSQFGTTALLPTLITDSLAVMQRAADAQSQAIRQRVPGVVGIHFEGPHLSIPKKGAHSAELIRPLSDDELAIFARDDLGIKVVTLAPENVLASDITKLVNLGVRVCLGHSNADYATTIAALAAGATGFTHLFNAMSPLTSREPGVTGAALLDKKSWVGIIADGLHVHDASLQLALACKPQGKVMLVTDAMPPVGTDQQSFPFFGRTVLRQGDKLTSTTGELAGSMLDMASAVRNTILQLQQPAEEALRMASLYPAQFLGLTNRGRLQVGQPADMVLFNNHWQCVTTWIAGQRVYG